MLPWHCPAFGFALLYASVHLHKYDWWWLVSWVEVDSNKRCLSIDVSYHSLLMYTVNVKCDQLMTVWWCTVGEVASGDVTWPGASTASAFIREGRNDVEVYSRTRQIECHNRVCTARPWWQIDGGRAWQAAGLLLCLLLAFLLSSLSDDSYSICLLPDTDIAWKWEQHVQAVSAVGSSRLYFLKQLKRAGAGTDDLLYFNLPQTKEEVDVFAHVCLSVCLSVSKITKKCVHGSGWNVACWQMWGHGRTD